MYYMYVLPEKNAAPPSEMTHAVLTRSVELGRLSSSVFFLTTGSASHDQIVSSVLPSKGCET